MKPDPPRSHTHLLFSSAQGSSAPIPQVDAALEKISAKTDNPVLCSRTILPFEYSAADPTSALQIEIKACLNRMQEALAQFKKLDGLASDMSTVQVCHEEYESAVHDLNGATDAIVAHDVGTIQTRLSGVNTFLGTCDDAVAESWGFKLPFNFKDEDVVALRKLASNCMAISILLH